MGAERERIARALEGGPLAGRPVDALPIPSTDAVAFAVAIDPSEVREAWAAVRPLVDELGRWPLALAGGDGTIDGDDLFDRSEYRDGEPSPEAVAARARDVSFEDGLAHFRSRAGLDHLDEHWDEHVDQTLAETRERVGTAPALEDLRARKPDHLALERQLLHFEEERAPSGDEAQDGAHLEWFEPRGDPTVLALLPTAVPEEAPAYASFFGADGKGGHEALIAVLRGWRERYGAELVASWGTMLQLTVERPPADLDAAFALAAEQELVAPDTLYLPGVSVRDHARVLRGRTEWFLHSRP